MNDAPVHQPRQDVISRTYAKDPVWNGQGTEGGVTLVRDPLAFCLLGQRLNDPARQ